MRKAVSYFMLGYLVSAWLLGSATVKDNTVQASTAAAIVTGTVKDDAGKPLVGALVALFTAQPGQTIGGSFLKSVTTDAEGKFKTNVAPGFYRLRAAANGFRPTFTLITLDAANKITHNFSLKRAGTVIESRGDKGDYRWIGRSVPRNILHYQADDFDGSTTAVAEPTLKPATVVHGITQFVAAAGRTSDFVGANFAVSTLFGGDTEFALIGQGGAGTGSPQRMTAIASTRPSTNHQITTAVGYTQSWIKDQKQLRALNQFSFSALDSWQLNKPLLLIFGVDYATFGNFGKGQDRILPRAAMQYSPNSRTKINAGFTPGTALTSQTPEGLNSENIQARFDAQPVEVAMNDSRPLLDRSRRMEMGFERVLNEAGTASLEAAAFYDVISNHGVGFLAVPLESSPSTQTAFQQVARQIGTMNGAARGARVLYTHRLSDYVTASIGYSVGQGQRFNEQALATFNPTQLFVNDNYQMATGKVEFDFSRRTGTKVSTVVRLSPSAVVFAIDPFAGRMSVYDPNVSIYVTQALPNFGLPGKWQALVDVRNLFDQANGLETDKTQLLAIRSQRSVRGAISVQW